MRQMPEMPGLPDWLVRETDESFAARCGLSEVPPCDERGSFSWFGRGIELLVELDDEENPLEPLFGVSWGCQGELAEGSIGTHFWDDALSTILRRARFDA
jgi:hypothetical protein